MISRSKGWLLPACVLAIAMNVSAVTVTLQVVDSNPTVGSIFGVLFDGTNIWASTGVGSSTIRQYNQNLAGMPLTGVTRTLTGPGCCGAMAWDGTNFVSASGATVGFFNAVTGSSVSSVTVTGTTGSGLIDGLDYDNGQIWFSPDVGNVYRLTSAGAVIGLPNPFLGGAGGYSGVERVDIGANSFVIVVNDASSPRRLCVHNQVDATLIGCATIANSRYEDLAFDGRYLYAADLNGNRLDKIDILVDGGAIFSSVPEPSSMLLVSTAAISLILRLRKVRNSRGNLAA